METLKMTKIELLRIGKVYCMHTLYIVKFVASILIYQTLVLSVIITFFFIKYILHTIHEPNFSLMKISREGMYWAIFC